MKSLKVVFLGTPDFAKASLDAIHQSHHQVVGVVTVPDKASGRGQKINASAVKKYADEHQIPTFQPEKLRDENFLKEIHDLEADVFVVVAFRMMPKVLYSMPRLGTFNLHASLLPQYRGAAPINFAVINGEKESGVTTFFINDKIDEGEILLQEKTAITDDDNAGTLHDKLMVIGAELVVKTLNGLADETLVATPQKVEGELKNAYKIFKEDTLIPWQKPLSEIHNFIRGLSPYPAALTTVLINGQPKIFKIFGGKYHVENHHHPVGTIIRDKKELKIYTKEGYYAPSEVQIEGKKRMDIISFLNGLRAEDTMTLEK